MKKKKTKVVSSIRLQKYLAMAGIASRRACERIISEGLVKVNGKVAELGVSVTPNLDKIVYNGDYVNLLNKFYYYKLYKPNDYICTTKDPRGRKSVYDFVKDLPHRVHAVGRLDRNTTGLLIFTNDGTFTQNLMHPEKKVSKTYRVTVEGRLTKNAVLALENGVELDDGITLPGKVDVENITKEESVFLLTIYEGRNRQVRRMCKEVGHFVKQLKRISIANIELGKLKVGELRPLNQRELKGLKKLQGS